MSKTRALVNRLHGGDLRSIGAAGEIVAEIGNKQDLFDEVFSGIYSDIPVVRMRSADVIEKVARKHPHLLRKHKEAILSRWDEYQQKEVKWHIALLVSYLELNSRDRQFVVARLTNWLMDKQESRIVRVNAMEGLAGIASQAPTLREQVKKLLEAQVRCGTPAMRARGRKLLEMP
uniref:HEAT repeat-containing protein n=1 Tax=Candidatus Kentrum sp. MB TaxID=2138164 RepID=A0A451B9F9_9GAMM|nr:MAG: hypothetical protein BECKMB1821G_GA0114241_101531 [Candidatus Kentron sp. MB]VFK29676.1 MAG: hypothetical protein BECKMB1821I_GA0114274_101130 [Candidatus Kentron sp. MB]VFK74867.1 MAG: hypothetical protein BECKMB1821H_GA0114242_101130 [Candidatus Kentron sp. MB]